MNKAEMNIPVRSIFFLLIALSLLSGGAAAQDWRRFRADSQLKGRTELKNIAGSPTNFESFQLGGGSVQPITSDVNGDGIEEVVYLKQGRIVAVRQEGAVLIDAFYGVTEIIAATDLDGTGSAAEIVAIDGFKRRLLIIESNGSLRWQYTFPEFVSLDAIYFKVADVTPLQPGKEIIVFPDHTKTEQDARGYFFSSGGLLYAAPIVQNLFGGQLNFPQTAVADIDGDGFKEVVVVGRPRLMIFSSDGELKQQIDFREGDPEGRHYGLLSLSDVNGDGRLEAVIVADDIPALSSNNKAAAITVFQLSPAIKRIWGATFPQQILRAPLETAVDLNGDGKSEIVVNLFNGTSQQIRVYRGDGDPSKNGQPSLLASIPDAYLWDIKDLDFDGRPDLMASIESSGQPSLSLKSQLAIYRLSSHTDSAFAFEASAKPINGMYALAAPLLAGQDYERVGSSDANRMKQLFLGNAPLKFLLYAENGEGGVNLQERFLSRTENKIKIKTDLDVQRPGTVKAILGSIGAESLLINREVDGLPTGELTIYIRRKQKLVTNDALPAISGGGNTPEARAADLDEDGFNEILVRASGGRILILSYDESINGLVQISSFLGNSAPIIENSDSGRPLIVTTRNDAGKLRLSVYEMKGTAANGNLRAKEKWGKTFQDLPGGANVDITTGRFTGANRFDIFLSAPRSRSFLLSGEDGSTVWSRSDLYTFGNYPSVRDFNKDGKDDVYIVTDNLYRIVDGSRGIDLVGPIDVSKFGTDFYSTPILSGDNEVLLVGPGSVAKIVDTGKLLWNFLKTINGKHAQRQETRILMGLAELGNGGSFDRIGGNYGEGDAFYVYDYATGLLVFKTPYQPITEITTADLDGDGKDEFIFGTAEGQIVAVRASDGTLVWSIKTDYFTGNPIAFSLSKGGASAIIFASGDGILRLYRLSQN